MKLIDISHVIDSNTPIYPGDCIKSLEKYRFIEKDYYNAYKLISGFHTGTHIDIPMHLISDKRTIDTFELENFIGNGVLIDVQGENIIRMKSEYKKIISNQDIVLIYTGFDKYYFDEDLYFHNHPIIDDEFTSFLISKKIKILGIDMPSPDYYPFKTHKTLLSNDIFILENLTNLNVLLNFEKFEVIAFPIKVVAEASFVRAVARIL